MPHHRPSSFKNHPEGAGIAWFALGSASPVVG